MEICPNEQCQEEVQVNELHCPACGTYLGPPNVREARQPAERDALYRRYREAQQRARDRGAGAALRRFERAMETTGVVLNVDLRFLHSFLENDDQQYVGYFKLVQAGARRPAVPDHDRNRRIVDEALFGEYKKEITYAAMSLNGKGLVSYGPYAMRLHDWAVNDRATFLDENSYKFWETHKFKGGTLPRGYRAVWGDRYKLAVAKLAHRVTEKTIDGEFSRILLSNTGDRKTDEYIEVHLFKGFTNRAVASVTGSSRVKSKKDKAIIAIVQDLLKAKEVDWQET